MEKKKGTDLQDIKMDLVRFVGAVAISGAVLACLVAVNKSMGGDWTYALKEKDENGNDVITNIDTLTLTKETGLNKQITPLNNSASTFRYAVGAVPSFGGLMTYTLLNWLPRFILIVPKIIKTYIETGTF